MKQVFHNLYADKVDESTLGAKISEIANKIGLKEFNIHLPADKLTSKEGVIILSHN